MAPRKKTVSPPATGSTLQSQPKKLTVDHQKIYDGRVSNSPQYFPDNKELEEHLVGKGLLTQAEISMIMSNNLMNELTAISKAHGIDSDEYRSHVKLLSDHLGKNANYFIKTNITLKETSVELSKDDLISSLNDVFNQKK